MKLGAQRGLTERRNSGPTGALSETIVAAWDFSDGINTIVGKDHGPYLLDAQIVNCPTRAMTGHNFSGNNFDWKHAPQEYGAIHFHDDDVDDARWEVDFEWTVPANYESDSYCVKLTTDEGDEDYIPFFVVPRPGEEQAKIAVMMPTISYMALRQRASRQQRRRGGTAGLPRADLAAPEHVPGRTPRVRRLDLRHPYGRKRPLPLVEAAADSQHPAAIRPLPDAGALAIPGRPASDLLAQPAGLQVRRHHRRGRELRRPRAARRTTTS